MIVERARHDLVRERLDRALKTGLYLGETYEDWRQFFKFFIDFLKSQQGPRGEVIKKAREFLNNDKATSDRLLKVLGLNSASSVRDVYVRYTNYCPSKLYHQHLVIKEKLEKMNFNVIAIQDPNSLMYKNIEGGIKAKRGADFDTSERMAEIQKEYVERHKQMTETEASMRAQLEQDQNYRDYIELGNYIKHIIDQWEKVDKETGNGSVERGKLFEQKCLTSGLQEVYKELGRDNFTVFTNCHWENRAQGEIDIALAEIVDGKLMVTVLIECKSRLFDLPHAYSQIGPNRIAQNKVNLNTKKGLLPVSDKAQLFIMTFVPARQFVLPFESRLKGELERATKNFSIQDIKEQDLYKELAPKFAGEKSPKDWFNENFNLVIVLD